MEAKFYEPKFKDGKVVAFADVELEGGLTIRGFRVINGKNGLFGSAPSKPVTVDGQTQWVKQVVFDTGEHREDFMAQLLRDYEAWRQNPTQSESASA